MPDHGHHTLFSVLEDTFYESDSKIPCCWVVNTSISYHVSVRIKLILVWLWESLSVFLYLSKYIVLCLWVLSVTNRNWLPSYNWNIVEYDENNKQTCIRLNLEIGLTAGVNGRQGMLTPPKHLTPPLIYSEVRLCPFSDFYFL
jgi:hypothetical protein